MMQDAVVVGGRHPDILARATELLDALSTGVRTFDLTKCVDFDWNAPVCLDAFAEGTGANGPTMTLNLTGAGLLKTVLHRTFTGPMPALYSRASWLSHWVLDGVTFIEDRGNTSPLVSLAYTDRGLVRNVATFGGGRGLELGVGGTLTINGRATPGVASEFCITDRCEFTMAAREGLYAFGARNFTIGGRTSLERNGQSSFAFPGLSIEGDPGARCGHGSIMDVAVEHDDPRHTGIMLRGLRGMRVGGNRHMLAGLDASCDDSEWHRNVVYDPAVMRRVGQRNRWIGRQQSVQGSTWSGYRLVDEPEASFDLHLQLDGSGT